MPIDFDQVLDRRTAPRVDAHLRAYFSDYNYEWEAVCTSMSVEGCFLEAEETLPIGADVEVRLAHPDGDEAKIDGRVRWVREPARRQPGGMGIAFDLRSRATVELLTDFVERLVLDDVGVASRYHDAAQPLSVSTVLYPSRTAPASPVLTDGERTFLAWIDGQRTLQDVRGVVGEESWEQICYAPFSLLGKGVLTTKQVMAAPPKAAASRGPARPPASAGQVAQRNAQAHAHYERALSARDSGDERRALTELRLAIMLAPGDAEISQLLAELEE